MFGVFTLVSSTQPLLAQKPLSDEETQRLIRFHRSKKAIVDKMLKAVEPGQDQLTVGCLIHDVEQLQAAPLCKFAHGQLRQW